ncbi:telomerase reverse transcriptase-like [Dermacentor andersoni]|uniref:telomerase reverse transcriptase-like n=1 Tax=Dermacentor andersoni TaxID=34620 RepID=UPI003B3AB53C
MQVDKNACRDSTEKSAPTTSVPVRRSDTCKVPKVFTLLYGDRASTLTGALGRLGLSRVQVDACALLHDLTDLFVVVPRSFPIEASDELSKLSAESVANYDNFRRTLTSLIQRKCRGDVFSFSWYRHGCFGSILFERAAFRELFAVLGPHCTAALLLGYYIFERADRDTFVQWIGPPASGVKANALPSTERSDAAASSSAPRVENKALHSRGQAATPCGSTVGSGTTKGGDSQCSNGVNPVSSTSSATDHHAAENETGGRKRPAGVSFSRLRALKAKRARRHDPKAVARSQAREDAYRFHAWTMLYVSDRRRVESRFMLGSPSNLESAKKLADKVFAAWPDCPVEVRHHAYLLRALRQLLKNHRSCRYGRLLTEHCPSQNGGEAGEVTCNDDVDDGDLLLLASLSDLVKDHVPVSAVSGFTHAALRKLIPVELFGSKTNSRKVISRAASVARMKKGEVLNTAAFAAELRADQVPWLQRMASTKGNKKLPWLRAMVTWCTKLAAAIVSVCFYVTDSRKGKRQLLFYRRRVWNAIIQVWASGEDILQHADASSGPPRMKGVGRLLPKDEAGGVRLLVTAPIANTLEARFRTLKVFLDSLKGNGGADSLYHRWKAFVAEWKARGKSKVFFVKADIENCFHSVDHGVALEVVGRAFERTEREARVVACTVVTLNAYGRVFKRWRQLFANDVTTMAYDPKNSSPPGRRVAAKAKILVAKTCLLPNMKELKQLLRDYLTKFHFRLHGKTYSLRKGVLQGGHLSADLADVYITAMQRRHLQEFGGASGEILVRATDDFLYVTSDEERARRFRDTFSRGFPDFGLFSNASKVQTNIEDAVDDDEYDVRTPAPIRQRADFCGYVFDMTTLEVFREPMSSFPVEWVVEKPERRAGEALKKYLQPWHLPISPLAMDSMINSRECVIAGVLDSFVALANRFFWSVNAMRYVDEGYVTEVVLGILDSFLVRALRWASGEGMELSVRDEELRYLFLLVFARKADRKASSVGKRLTEVVRRVGKKLAPICDLEHLTACVELALS